MKNRSIYALVLFFIAVAVFGTEQVVRRAKLSSHVMPPTSTTGNVASEESDGPDFSDDHVLMGWRSNVFVGKVLNKSGSKDLMSKDDPSYAPTSQYTVRILLNIKGNLRGTMMLYQYEERGNPLLQIGSTYTFAAIYSRAMDLYGIVYYPYDYTLLTDDQVLSDAQLQALAENDDRTKALQAAYPNELLSKENAQNGFSYNSYASRQYDASGQLIDDTVVLHEQYMAAHPSDAIPSDMPANNPPSDNGAPQANAPAAGSVSPSATPGQSTAPDVSVSVAPTDSPTPTPTDSPTPLPSDAGTIPAAS
jgi:hypothetical protein